jgi:glycosyltransferase involved in cell wall biosynthesis
MEVRHPLVSVVIPAYNREKDILRALNSVISQTYKDFEIIIVDDGSQDRTKEVIIPYLKEGKVKYLYQNNQGASEAMNNGIKDAQGKYIALLHSDDYWSDDKKLEKQVNFLEKNIEYFLVGGGIIKVKENGKISSRILYPQEDANIRKTILISCPFASSVVVFKKSAWEQAGGFNKKLEVCEDWDLWLRLGKLGKFYNFHEYFAHYQESERSLSHAYYRRSFQYNLAIIKKYHADYPASFIGTILNICYYLYSFLPFHQKLLPLFSKIKRGVFGKPPYEDIRG